MNNIKATKKIKNYDILFFDELCYNINIIQKNDDILYRRFIW